MGSLSAISASVEGLLSLGGNLVMADDKPFVEIGDLAAWSVTSAKPGNGVDMIRDGSIDTYWQSDGLQPHLISIQFQRKVEITSLQLYTDFKADESYTPNKIVVRAGNSSHDVRDIKTVELKEPSGWITVELSTEAPGAAKSTLLPLRAFLLQVVILSNHQNGRDTHIRSIQVYGPRPDPLVGAYSTPLHLTTHAFTSYASIR